MAKAKVPLLAHADDTIRALGETGCLLVSGKSAESKDSNVMAIGWGFIGVLWAKPVFVVAVRPSRYTHKLIEETGEFTVNVPGKGMKETVKYCGSVSGREHDKFKERGLTLMPGKKVKAPIISECAINYECKVVYKTQFVQRMVPGEAVKKWYPEEDYHTLYFGEIVAAHADEAGVASLH